MRHQVCTYVRKVMLSSCVSLSFCLSQVGIVINFIGWVVGCWLTESNGGARCINMPNFIKIRQSVAGYRNFLSFQNGSRHHLDFLNSQVLADRVQRDEKHHPVKFPQNRLIRCEDIAMFLFSKWQLPPSWIFKIHKFYQHVRSGVSSCINVPNFIQIGQS